MNHSSKHNEVGLLNNVPKNKIKAKNSVLKLEKDKKIGNYIITDVRNFFRLNKETTKEIKDHIIRDVRILCRLTKKIKQSKKE